jgi:dUTP pyrophosphatase
MHEGDAGLDLFSVEDKDIDPNTSSVIRTGIAIELPETGVAGEVFEAQVRSRSGLAAKHCVAVLNSPGTIDFGYRGEICVILINHGKEVFRVKKGMRIAQLVINRVARADIVEVDDLNNTDRNTSGFGSTGL